MIKEAIKEGQPYCLAFVDIRMPPGWDGIETIKHIWSVDKSIQIVICTAYSDYSWEQTITELGTTDNLLILKKPFDFIAVRQLASALTTKWQLFNETKLYTASLEENIRQRTQSLQHSLSRLRATLESSNDGILVVDNEYTVIDYNNKFISMWKIPDYLKREKAFDLFINFFKDSVEMPEKLLKDLQILKHDTETALTKNITLKNKKIYEYYTQPQKLENKTIGRIFSFRDVTQKIVLENKLKYQAHYDSLTGLPNRIYLIDLLKQHIVEASAQQTKIGVFFLDLDRFKLVNDSLSHAVGDKLLYDFAQRLKSAIKPSDSVARLGGDEFVVITNNVIDEKNVASIAENLIHMVSIPFFLAKREITMSVSVGAAIYPNNGEEASILLRNADAAMYSAKKTGSNQFKLYTDDLNRINLEFLEKEMQLRQAMINGDLFLLYQPQIDVKTNRIVAVEALVRWNHAEKGVILPLDFIPLAEETGLIIPLGEWVIRTACQQNKKWQDAGLPAIRVAVNITSQQLNHYSLLEFVTGVLQKTGLKPEYLELELTENAIINNLNVINTIHELKRLGIYIALDDFGTGYSSLSYLKDIQLDRLKIDKSFVQNITVNRDDEVIIQAIITMAKSLELEVLAEGVETQGQMDFLTQNKCEEIQGYYFNKPLTAQELETIFLKKHKLINQPIKEK